MLNKKGWLRGVVLLLSLPSALADVSGTLSNVWNRILGVGRLEFLGLSEGTAIVAFTRILIWIAVFTIFFGLISAVSGKEKKMLAFLNRSQAMIVAGVLATMAAVFLPAEVLLATGAGWATAVAFLLIGVPVAGVAWLLWQVPWDDEPETKWTVFLKLVLCLVLFWILTVMKTYVGGLA